MLIGSLDGLRVSAFGAARGLDYRCPNPACGKQLILKQGRLVVHHFAHKVPKCDWVSHETAEHLTAKEAVWNSLRRRGLRAEIEFIVDAIPGDRRADVMTWSPDNLRVAFELQHSSISLDEIERRATSYAQAGIAQFWIPFLRHKFMNEGKKAGDCVEIERYTPRPFERWIYSLYEDFGMWMYYPYDQSIWLGFIKPTQLFREESSWYGEGGEEMSSGGYSYPSKKFCDLTLFGPFHLHSLRIRTANAGGKRVGPFNLPRTKIASFVRPKAA